MATLTEMQEEYKNSVAAATHLLLVGPSKSGKSSYVAQAAIDGFDIFYVDNDNGLATLIDELKDHPEAMARVYYFNPIDFTDFITTLLRAGVFRYNERTRKVYQAHEAQPTDVIWEVRAIRMGRARNVLASFDSLTSLAYDALKDAAKAEKVDLTQIAKYGREIYGPSGFAVTQIVAMLQLAPFSFVMQAHPAIYEIKEKPPNQTAREITERDMIIRDTWEIPMSTSGPHGFSLGKYFNQIGWLEIDRWDKFQLSFKQKAKRIVGGTPGGVGDPRGAYRYSKLFGGGLQLPQPIDPELPWIRRVTAEELKAESNANKTPAAASQTPALATTGKISTAPKLGGLKLGGGK